MKTKQQLREMLAQNTQLTEIPSDGNMYYGIYDDVVAANKAAIYRITKPQDWSLLYDGSKFMIARDKNVKEIMQKYKSWKLVGAYDSEAFIKKKLIDVNNLSKHHKVKTSKELAQLLAADFANPKFDESVVKEVKKQLKSLTPQLMKATGNKMNFTTFNLPKDGGQVRVSVHVEDGPNEDAGSINTTVRANGAGLLSDKNMYAYVEPLKPSQRMGSEFYHMAVTIFKNK
jgi:hypothetical protein